MILKRFNILYWLMLPLVLLAIYTFSIKLRISYKEYFGYAENRHSEINLDRDVVVTRVHVQTGQRVSKGQLLLEVRNQDMSQEISQLHLSLQGVRIRADLTEAELQAEILDLQRQRDLRLSELNTRISTAENEVAFYRELSGLSGGSVPDQRHPGETLIAQLKAESAQIKSQYDQLIAHYQKIRSQPKTTLTEGELMQMRQSAIAEKLREFQVLAPYDGIVGNIHGMEGEYIPAYTSLISFYEMTPPTVTAFIQEKFDIRVQIGDSVLVQSVYNPEKQVQGIVSAKGHRIVEIPERLRKIPDLKIYGVEVYIEVPHGNPFLQHEVLKVRPLNPKA